MTRTVKGLIALCVVAAIAVAIGFLNSHRGETGDGSEGGASGKSSALDDGAKALESEDWSKARDSFTAALEADPTNVDALYGRAAAYAAQGEEHYQLARSAATNQDAEKGREEASKADEFFNLAVEDCDAALKVNPEFADAHFLKGVVFQYQGKWEQGIDAYTKCVECAPDRGEAYHRRGEIREHTGDTANSLNDFKKATELGYAKTDEDAEGGEVDFSDLNYETDALQGSDAE